jgi:hypothetical protein
MTDQHIFNITKRVMARSCPACRARPGEQCSDYERWFGLSIVGAEEICTSVHLARWTATKTPEQLQRAYNKATKAMQKAIDDNATERVLNQRAEALNYLTKTLLTHTKP